MTRFVVIGGSDAGISAALRARELDPSCQVRLVVADRFPNYSICGLPFFLSGETPRSESLAHRTRDEIEAQGIELSLDTLAERIEPESHRVVLRGAASSIRVLEYDRLLIATGAVPARPRIAGLDRPGVYQLHSMADSFAVNDHLAARRPERAAIIGGGYIGLEMADALRRRGLAVSLWEVRPALLPTVDPAFGAMVQAELEKHDVEVHTSTPIDRIEQESAGLVLHGGGQVRMTADLALVVTGVRPSVELAQACGVVLGSSGAIQVNRRMETNLADIYAAGDCVETHHRLMARPTYLPLGTTAHKQGRIAGANAVGVSAEFEGSLGTQVVKIFEVVVGRTGLRDSEAQREGLDPMTLQTKVFDHKAYYPGATDMFFRVTADRRTHRLLGAQVLGRYGSEVSKRIDVFAAALFHSMKVTAMADLDLSYTPPLGSPWDPVQMSAMALARELETGHPKVTAR